MRSTITRTITRGATSISTTDVVATQTVTSVISGVTTQSTTVTVSTTQVDTTTSTSITQVPKPTYITKLIDSGTGKRIAYSSASPNPVINNDVSLNDVQLILNGINSQPILNDNSGFKWYVANTGSGYGRISQLSQAGNTAPVFCSVVAGNLSCQGTGFAATWTRFYACWTENVLYFGPATGVTFYCTGRDLQATVRG